MHGSRLQQLVTPLDRATFLTDHWGRAPFWSAPDLQRVDAVIRELGVRRERAGWADYLSIVRGLRDVRVWDSGEHSTPIVTDGATAVKLLHAGMTSYANVSEITDEIKQLRECLRLEFGLPNAPRCNLFVARTGGAQLHFDPNDVLTLHLLGSKVWRIACNETVSHPVSGYSHGRDSEHFAPYASGPFPSSIPEHHLEIEMTAGSVLYVPAGWWHETRVIGDSVSLAVQFVTPAKVDMVLGAVRQRLLRHADWRKVADALACPAVSDQSAVDGFQALLSTLMSDVGHLTGEDIFESVYRRRPELSTWSDSCPGVLIKAPLATWHTVSVDPAGRVAHLQVSGATGERVMLSGDAETAEILAWMDQYVGSFKFEQLCTTFSGLCTKSLRRLVDELLDAGFLRQRDAVGGVSGRVGRESLGAES